MADATPTTAAGAPLTASAGSDPQSPSLLDYAAAGLAFLLPVGFSTGFTSPFWTPKAALLVLTLPFGAALAGSMLRERRAAAVAGLAFVGVASVSTALAGQPDLAFFGAYSHGIGWLFIASLFSVWALGSALSPKGKALVERALVAAILVNVAFALVQPLVDLTPYGLGLLQSRTPGLMGNPVHTSGLFAGGFAIVTFRTLERPWPFAIFVAFTAAGVQLAGSRFALLGIIGLAVGLLAWKRSARAVLIVLFTVGGIALGQGINALGHGVSGTSRIDEGLGGNSTGARVDTWQDASSAIAEKPLIGHGPGRYLAATAPHRSLDLARRGPEKYFRDAHNIVVEWATTTGLMGLGAFLAWLVLAFRGARGPLLWFAGGILVLHTVQPLYVGTTPLAFLALGAAGRSQAMQRLSVTPKAMGAAVGLASLAAAASLLRGEAGLQQADLAYSPAQASSSMAFLPDWPEPRAFTARMEVSLSITERDDQRFDDALALYREAAAADPQDPRRWNELAGAYLGNDRPREALEAYRAAVGANPYSYGGLTGIARSAIALDDPRTASDAVDRAAVIVGDDHPTIVDLRRRIGDAMRAGPVGPPSSNVLVGEG